mgnify:CR=1 FL=1
MSLKNKLSLSENWFVIPLHRKQAKFRGETLMSRHHPPVGGFSEKVLENWSLQIMRTGIFSVLSYTLICEPVLYLVINLYATCELSGWIINITVNTYFATYTTAC